MIEVESVDTPAPQTPSGKTEKKKMAAFEQALFKAEDEQDVRAASTAKAEQVAEMAEFNENVPIKADVSLAMKIKCITYPNHIITIWN